MKVYTDPTSGEWVAEHETRDAVGEVTRRTEWFKSEADALHFSRTGLMPDSGWSTEEKDGSFTQVDIPKGWTPQHEMPDSDEEHMRNCNGCSYCDPHPGSSPRP